MSHLDQANLHGDLLAAALVVLGLEFTLIGIYASLFKYSNDARYRTAVRIAGLASLMFIVIALATLYGLTTEAHASWLTPAVFWGFVVGLAVMAAGVVVTFDLFEAFREEITIDETPGPSVRR